MTVAVDRRSPEVCTTRVAVEEAWMDVTASAFEVRRELGRAYVDHRRGRDPITHLYAADQRLIRLIDTARQRAGEASGLTFIPRGQLRLFGRRTT